MLCGGRKNDNKTPQNQIISLDFGVNIRWGASSVFSYSSLILRFLGPFLICNH